MDQNYQFSQNYYNAPQAPAHKNAKYYRQTAWKALKGNWINTSVVQFLSGLVLSAAMMVAIIPIYAVLMVTILARGESDAAILVALATFIGLYVLMFAAMFFIGGPLQLGLARTHLDVVDGKPVMITDLFRYFKTSFWKSAGLYALYTLIPTAIILPVGLFGGIGMGVALALLPENGVVFAIGSILTFLLVIAVVILAMVVALRYALCFFIMAEYPQVRAIDALRNSALLMKGKKWKLFCLQFSFIGWALLLAAGTLVTCGMASMVAPYPLSAYMMTAQAAFYDEVANRAAAKEVEFPSLNPEDYDPDAPGFHENF
ncbi:MAG: DUF975 family protein [Clostridia bacterium]|nr:DUF975 family protein [Clostridia bacterium]